MLENWILDSWQRSAAREAFEELDDEEIRVVYNIWWMHLEKHLENQLKLDIEGIILLPDIATNSKVNYLFYEWKFSIILLDLFAVFRQPHL